MVVSKQDISDAKNYLKPLGGLELMLATVIWHDILFYVNTVGKKLQLPSMCIESTLQQTKGMYNYF